MDREQIQRVVNQIEKILIAEGIPKGSVTISFNEQNELSESENIMLAEKTLSNIQGEQGVLGCGIGCCNGVCGLCCTF